MSRPDAEAAAFAAMRRAGLRRALAGRGLRDGGRAARARACSPGPNGPRRCRPKSSSPDAAADGSDYYDCWLRALEKLLAAKGVAAAARCRPAGRAWQRAAHATPHGKPILLENDPEHFGESVTIAAYSTSA